MRWEDSFRSLVRLTTSPPNPYPVGAGAALEGGLVLTAAHVVNTALGRGLFEPAAPSGEVHIEFSYCAEPPRVARVIDGGWLPPSESDVSGDLAVLRVIGPAPADVLPSTWRSLDGRPRSTVSIKGFTDVNPDGIDADACLGTVQPSGLLQLTDETRAGLIGPGFSGAPVWCDQLGFVGLVVRAHQMARLAWMVPADLIDRLLPGVALLGSRAALPNPAETPSTSGAQEVVRTARAVETGRPRAPRSAYSTSRARPSLRYTAGWPRSSEAPESTTGATKPESVWGPIVPDTDAFDGPRWLLTIASPAVGRPATDACELVADALARFGFRRACPSLTTAWTSDEILDAVGGWLDERDLSDAMVAVYIAAVVRMSDGLPYLYTSDTVDSEFDAFHALGVRSLAELLAERRLASMLVGLDLAEAEPRELVPAGGTMSGGEPSDWFDAAARRVRCVAQVDGSNVWQPSFANRLLDGLWRAETQHPTATKINLDSVLATGGLRGGGRTVLACPPDWGAAVGPKLPPDGRGGDGALDASFVDVASVSEFVGRAATLRFLGSQWASGRPIALIGPPGAGKSALLQTVAGASLPEVRAQIQPGVGPLPPVGWVNLALPMKDGDAGDVVDALGALFAQHIGSIDGALEVLRDYQHPFVMLLDDVDRTADPESFRHEVVEPIGAIPHVFLLVSARGPAMPWHFAGTRFEVLELDDRTYDDRDARRSVIERILRSGGIGHDASAIARKLLVRASTFRLAHELARRELSRRAHAR